MGKFRKAEQERAITISSVALNIDKRERRAGSQQPAGGTSSPPLSSDLESVLRLVDIVNLVTKF